MKTLVKVIIVVNLTLFLLFYNNLVKSKEKVLDEGELIFLKLAPKDPRSLMQGDYMRLRYAISRGVSMDGKPKRGYCRLALDSNNVATKVLENTLEKGEATKDQIWVRYFHNDRRLQLGAESYFFQEGTAAKYDSTQYGAVKVDEDGNTVLVGLYDRHFNLLE